MSIGSALPADSTIHPASAVGLAGPATVNGRDLPPVRDGLILVPDTV
jgi:hypothetical protein